MLITVCRCPPAALASFDSSRILILRGGVSPWTITYKLNMCVYIYIYIYIGTRPITHAKTTKICLSVPTCCAREPARRRAGRDPRPAGPVLVVVVVVVVVVIIIISSRSSSSSIIISCIIISITISDPRPAGPVGDACWQHIYHRDL